MGVKMNLRIIMKNHAADPEIGFLTKTISKPYSRTTAMPPAWKLKFESYDYLAVKIFAFVRSNSTQ